jgi:hypothetical protein
MWDGEIVLISETKSLLTSMLDRAGVSPGKAAPDVLATVEVFRRFATVPVDDAASSEDDGDGVLAQFGTFGVGGVPEFRADLTRQFVEADEVVMWQLCCTLRWSSSAETEALGSGHLWSFGMPLDDFFAEALALPGWAWAAACIRAPKHLTVELDQI